MVDCGKELSESDINIVHTGKDSPTCSKENNRRVFKINSGSKMHKNDSMVTDAIQSYLCYIATGQQGQVSVKSDFIICSESKGSYCYYK